MAEVLGFDEGIDAHDERRGATVQVSHFDRLSDLCLRGAGGGATSASSMTPSGCAAIASVTMPIRILYLAGMAPSFKIRSCIATYDRTNCGSWGSIGSSHGRGAGLASTPNHSTTPVQSCPSPRELVGHGNPSRCWSLLLFDSRNS